MANLAIYSRTVTAAAALSAHRACTVAGAVPAAGANALGFTRNAAAIGEDVTVDVVGSTHAEAGAAIAVGAAVEVDNQGRVITLASGAKVGRMAPMQAAATAAGQVVEILLIPN